MRQLVVAKLSPNKMITSNGYLICNNAVLARTGKQEYLKSELYEDCDDDEIIEVDRKPEQVFSDATISSFENVPLTCEHPYENVTPENYKDYSVGYVRDVHRGKYNGQDVLLGTLIVTDPQCIQDIKNGYRTELSCGYDCDITEGKNPQQINIRGNHVALCEQGRAGIAKIVDSVSTDGIKYQVRYTCDSKTDGKLFNSLQGAMAFARKIKDEKYGSITRLNIYKNKENSSVLFKSLVNDSNIEFINYRTRLLHAESKEALREIKEEIKAKYDEDLITDDELRRLMRCFDNMVVTFKDSKVTDADLAVGAQYIDSNNKLWQIVAVEGDKYILNIDGSEKNILYKPALEEMIGKTLKPAQQLQDSYVGSYKGRKIYQTNDSMYKIKDRNNLIVESDNLDELKQEIDNMEKDFKSKFNDERTDHTKGFSKNFYNNLIETLKDNLEDVEDQDMVLDSDNEEDYTYQKNQYKRELRSQIKKYRK